MTGSRARPWSVAGARSHARGPSALDPAPAPEPAAPEGLPRPTRERVPAHLRRYVVEQNYAEYNAVDQAVWRFVLTQIYETLRHTAHPAYEHGLAETGIDRARIPRIEEMDRKLQRFGWGAVCVDGFIPPRAFVEFQALGILPIAADMRTKEHLVYTPAPDIIHEAAGHAPILPDPAYAAYLKRIGEVGAQAFSSPEDERVYQAIFRVSEVKERPDATTEEIARAERDHLEATQAVTRVTEAARMSRLYWWTAEYGLVGTPRDYRLYGAGLLSSLGESHSCHDPSVRKVPLSLECLDTPYDITRAQPQLFVARDFEHLEEVLQEAASTLAASRGGPEAVAEAVRSGEVATLTVGVAPRDTVDLIGVVRGYATDRGLERITLDARVGVARSGRLERILLAEVRSPRTEGSTAFGPIELFVVPPEAVQGARVAGAPAEGAPPTVGSVFSVESGGVPLEGVVRWALAGTEGRPLLVVLDEARLGDVPLPNPTLLAPGNVQKVRAGASDPAYHPASLFPGRAVPEPRRFSERELALRALYEEAEELTRRTWGTSAAAAVSALHERLQRDAPDEWLLRWELLELLHRHSTAVSGPEEAAARDVARPTARALRRELEHLEVRFRHAQPIALGLRHLAPLDDPR